MYVCVIKHSHVYKPQFCYGMVMKEYRKKKPIYRDTEIFTEPKSFWQLNSKITI
jgi:hypothetical protein